MHILRLCLVVVIISLGCVCSSTSSYQQQSQSQNLTNWAKSRQKRFLIYSTAGVCKYIVSYGMPVELQDKKQWRALSNAWNLQWQYTLPTQVEYWWNTTTFQPSKNARSLADLPPEPTDLSATFLYAILENYMNNQGLNGRQCLHRAICENAQVHYVGGVFDKIYQRLLTPERSMDEHYRDSHTMGAKGVDCYKAFAGCPKGASLFDQFVRIGTAK